MHSIILKSYHILSYILFFNVFLFFCTCACLNINTCVVSAYEMMVSSSAHYHCVFSSYCVPTHIVDIWYCHSPVPSLANGDSYFEETGLVGD